MTSLFRGKLLKMGVSNYLTSFFKKSLVFARFYPQVRIG